MKIKQEQINNFDVQTKVTMVTGWMSKRGNKRPVQAELFGSCEHCGESFTSENEECPNYKCWIT